MFPRRGAVALVTTVLALVLLLQFKTPDEVIEGSRSGSAGSALAGATSGSSAPPASGEATDGSGEATDGSGSGADAAPSTGPSSEGASTVTGPVVATRYGDVEVEVTVDRGTITAVVAVELPTGGRSGQISRVVAPILANEALSAQSAQIDIVSGATYTSQAYARSLQAALDHAALAPAALDG